MDTKQLFTDFSLFLELMYNLAKSTITNPDVEKFLHDPDQKFDLVLAEWMFTEIYSTLPALFDCPFIWFSTLEPHWMVLRLIDETMNPAYSTDYRSGSVAPYPFTTRLEQLWQQITRHYSKWKFEIKEELFYHHAIAPILRKRGKAVPPYKELMYNASLMLGNSHVSLGMAPKLPQSYIPIAGYVIDAHVTPLPQELDSLDVYVMMKSVLVGFCIFLPDFINELNFEVPMKIAISSVPRCVCDAPQYFVLGST